MAPCTLAIEGVLGVPALTSTERNSQSSQLDEKGAVIVGAWNCEEAFPVEKNEKKEVLVSVGSASYVHTLPTRLGHPVQLK